MTITTEQSLFHFQFWSGAIANRNRFSYDELETLESILEDCFPEGINETQLNDIFWFEPETLCEWLDIPLEEYENREEDYYLNSI